MYGNVLQTHAYEYDRERLRINGVTGVCGLAGYSQLPAYGMPNIRTLHKSCTLVLHIIVLWYYVPPTLSYQAYLQHILKQQRRYYNGYVSRIPMHIFQEVSIQIREVMNLLLN